MELISLPYLLFLNNRLFFFNLTLHYSLNIIGGSQTSIHHAAFLLKIYILFLTWQYDIIKTHTTLENSVVLNAISIKFWLTRRLKNTFCNLSRVLVEYLMFFKCLWG